MSVYTPDIRTIAIMENERLYNAFQKGEMLMIYPEETLEDGDTQMIGFGHLITNDENFDKGLPLRECWNILERDYAEALLKVVNHIGVGVFKKLNTSQVFLLTDFAFNGVLPLFPKFTRALVNEHYEKAIEEHKRYYTVGGKKKELKRRNEMTKAILEDLVDQSRFLVQEVIE